MKPEIWIKLAQTIKENYEKFDGFVVLHGTDTMSYSASALSFMLNNLQKPVIFTGSQLPIGEIRTDGKENLITAIEIAAANIKGKAIVPEVCIYFESKLFRGNRTHKYSAENFNAFISPNYPLLAEAGISIKYNHSVVLSNSKTDFSIYSNIDNSVGIVKLFPGIKPELVESILNTKNIKAFVLETYGSGNAPTEEWLINLLKKAIKAGKVIVNVTQCITGSVVMGKYETSTELKNIGIISGKNITTEAAVTKLMILLGLKISMSQVKLLMSKNIKGEMD